MFVWLLLAVCALWVVLFRYRRRRMYKLAALIPGPRQELPVIGVAHTLSGDTGCIMRAMQKFSYEAIENDGIIRGWLNHILYFVLVHPLDVEVILKTCLDKDELHRFIRKVIGNGGIFAPVSIWRRRRKVLVPAFSPKIVENFVDVFSEQSETLTKQLSAAADGKMFSVWPYLSAYTLDSVCESAMGVKIKAQSNPNSKFLVSMNKILNLVCERIFKIWLQLDFFYNFFPQFKQHQMCLEALHGFTDDVIAKKRLEIKQEKECKPEADNEYDLGSYKRKSFLDLLITLSGGDNGYTNVELREEVLTLTIAGTDTSAVAIGYTLKLLAKYPEIQERVYNEIYATFGDSDRPLVKEDLFSLQYLDRVVRESIRLFPPVPFIIRKVLEDIKLPSGRTLPAGSGVVVSIYGVHRNPKYWGPTAEHFDPDRFLPDRLKLAHSTCYMPFSNGPRNCPGYQYALMSIKTALSSILRRYKVQGDPEKGPIPHIDVKLDIMMKAVDGYQIALERRNKCQEKN